MEVWISYDFFEGNISIPSALVPGVNIDQSLSSLLPFNIKEMSRVEAMSRLQEVPKPQKVQPTGGYNQPTGGYKTLPLG